MKLKRPDSSASTGTGFLSRKGAPSSGEKPRSTEFDVRVAAGVEPGRWWNVWVLGRPNVQNLGHQPKFHFGYVEGNENEAVRKARLKCPQFIGSIELEERPNRR